MVATFLERLNQFSKYEHRRDGTDCRMEFLHHAREM